MAAGAVGLVMMLRSHRFTSILRQYFIKTPTIQHHLENIPVLRRFHREYRPPSDSPYEYHWNRDHNHYGSSEPPEYTWSIPNARYFFTLTIMLGDWIYDRRRYFMRGGMVVGGAGLYYWSHLERAPITNRRRFMQVSLDQEKVLAQISLQEVMKQYGLAILPASHPVSRYVRSVAHRVIAAIQPELTSPDTQWKVYVIEAPVANAFVLPGGEIFVFTGMLPIAANEDGLAAVIGHEIAHKIARHVAEKVSFYQFASIAMMLFQVLIAGDLHMPFGDTIKNLLVFLPFSRKCEIEADYIGMLLMARACFDPAEAAQVWRRMAEQEKGPRPPAFLSTHPGHFERIKKINEWLPEARKQFNDAGCYEQNKGMLDSFFSNF